MAASTERPPLRRPPDGADQLGDRRRERSARIDKSGDGRDADHCFLRFCPARNARERGVSSRSPQQAVTQDAQAPHRWIGLHAGRSSPWTGRSTG